MTNPAARANALRIEAVARIPAQVPHAVREMEEEAERPRRRAAA